MGGGVGEKERQLPQIKTSLLIFQILGMTRDFLCVGTLI